MVANGCCMEWEQEIVLYSDNELSPNGHERVEKHLSKCHACSYFYREMQQEEQLIAGFIRHEVKTDIQEDRITEQVMRQLPESKSRHITWKVAEFLCSTTGYLFAQGKWHVAVATSILICLIGTMITLNLNNETDQYIVHITRGGTLIRTQMQEPQRVEQPQGEWFRFPDGSVAYATQNTWFTIHSYPDKDDPNSVGEDRQINLLSGEMFFDVKPTPGDEGFTVQCLNARTKVFGTQFYVCINTGPNKETTVAVREGRVMVEKQNLKGSLRLSEGKFTQLFGVGKQIVLRTPKPMNGLMRNRLDWFDQMLKVPESQRLVPDPGNTDPLQIITSNQDSSSVLQVQTPVP